MAIFYTDSASFFELSVTGSTILSSSNSSTIPLQIIGTGSTILSVSGSVGEILNISDTQDTTNLFSVSLGSEKIFDVQNNKTVTISGSNYIYKDNTDYTNTAGANSHIILNNPNAGGQTVISSVINGTLVGKIRSDYVGNMTYVAGGLGIHDFWTGGDYGIGTHRMRIANNGNVGIGTSSPSYKLTVAGDVAFPNLTSTAQTNVLTYNSSTGQLFYTASSAIGGTSFPYTGNAVITGSLLISGSGLTITGSLKVSGSITGSLFGTASYATTASYVSGSIFTSTNPALSASYALTASYVLNSNPSSLIYSGSVTASVNVGTTSFQLISGSSTFMYVSSSGNVGIGTTTPQAKLDVTGWINASSGIVVAGSGFTNGIPASGGKISLISNAGLSTLTYSPEGGAGFSHNFITNGFSRLYINDTGVGIGTSNPQYSLDITGSNPQLRLITTGGDDSFRVRLVSGGSPASVEAYLKGQSIFSAWHANPQNIDVNGTYTTQSAISTGLIAGDPNSALVFGTNRVETARISNTGKFGIGTKSPTYNLDVSGSTNVTRIQGSGSANPIFLVQGSLGELFSVTDSLSGSLFSVNDISGLPIVEVFSDNTTLIGNYLAPALYTTVKKTIGTGTGTIIYQVPTSSYDGMFVDYSIKSGSVARVGNIMTTWTGSGGTTLLETSSSIGTATAFTFSSIITGSNFALTGSATTAGWTVKTIIRTI